MVGVGVGVAVAVGIVVAVAVVVVVGVGVAVGIGVGVGAVTYELVICLSLIGGNCVWQITPQPSLAACEAVIAAILAADREAGSLPPPVMYCRERAYLP